MDNEDFIGNALQAILNKDAGWEDDCNDIEELLNLIYNFSLNDSVSERRLLERRIDLRLARLRRFNEPGRASWQGRNDPGTDLEREGTSPVV